MAQHEGPHCPGSFVGVHQSPQDGEVRDAGHGTVAPERGASVGGGDRRGGPGGDSLGAASSRAQLGVSDTGRHGAEDAIRPGTEGETGRGAEGETGRGGEEDAARPGTGGGERTDGAAPEQPVGQVERTGPAPEPTKARDEGATVVESVVKPVLRPAPEVVPVVPVLEMPPKDEPEVMALR